MLKMIPLEGNEDVACFLVTKHSWKGKYKRIFSVGTMGITTYNPNSLEVTNKWPYSDISLMPSGKVSCQQNNEFSVTNLKKNDTMKFSSEHRAQVLTDALKCRFAVQKRKETLRYHAYKYHWSETKLPVMLEVTPFSLDQLDPTSCAVLASYYYKDLEGLAEVTDLPGGFAVVCGGFGRTHLFASPNYGEIRHKMQEAATTNVGISIKVLEVHVTRDEVVNQRFGKYSGDEHITSASEFIVQKVESSRHPEPQKRLLCLSETCLLERDHQTYSICTLRPLSDIFALVRSRDNPQLFTVEYVNGHTRTYTANDRDSLLASLLDGVRASNNRDVHVKMIPTSRGKRLGPLNIPVEDETESMHLKFLLQPPGRRTFAEIVERFNANVPYSGLRHSVSQDGLFAENKEKLISGALQSLIDNEGDQNVIPLPELEGQFHALRRLAASKVGFAAFTTMQGFREKIGLKVVKALKREDEGVTHAAMDMICALMHPMHDDYDLRQEQLNKSSLLSSTKFLESLLEMWIGHVTHGTGALVVSAMLDYLTFALCVPYSETTDGKHFDTLLEMVADRGRSLFRLFQHPSLAVVKGAGLVMRAVIEEGEEEVAARMQDLALAEGALPRHLLIALFTTGSDGRLLTHRQLSRHLVGLWVTGHPTAMGLLKRIMPLGLLSYLDSKDDVPAEALEQERLNNRDNLKIAQEHANKNRRGPQWAAIERQFRVVEKHVEHALQHWAVRFGLERKEDKIKERPIVLRKRRERIKSEANWPLFYYKFGQDHTLPNLIWNHKTREELRDGLENELRTFNADRDLAGNALIAWNHNEFEIQYQCLSDEVRIGDYYLRLLLEKEDNPDSPIRRSYEFFNDLYHRFLLTSKPEMKCMCLQAMAIVYGRHFEDIGPFSDTKYILGMLDRCTDRMERDRLVLFINKLILHRRNVKDIMAANGVRILVDLLTLAHLHTSRAVVPTQSNVIEAGPNVVNESEKEWHYLSNSGDKKGPVSFQEMRDLWKKGELNPKTKCWAQGMDTWRTLQQIPQLKWCLMAKGAAVMNESDLATLILNILIQMCQYFPSRDADDAVIRPLPRVKRLLSETVCLPHVVQLLLTFDPVLVEKVATLLCEVMKDNPMISTLYLSGVFYFILMYTGSNVLPIARFLQLTHMKQAFRGSDTLASEIMQRSILGQLLPEAMVSYLENHGAEKFAQIYLGEFDTPEAIWNSEMRRMLIEKLCAHVADFSPRLRSNTRAIYTYCAIPVVRYPQLEQELFCSIFYLRHLCDHVRFPDWPINEPVKLLKDVLEAWKKEVEKKPPAMSVDDAYEALGLQRGVSHDEAASRKAYYRLAQQFHPDKNPEGRDKFESVSKAYEFLCSRSIWTTQGPNPNNIVLILQTQSILFHRYSEELQPYKYAGYPQLIKTIQMETDDDQLFSKSAPLLSAASELAYHTVHCSALNAEELRRERGLDVLLDAYSRCVSVLSASSKPSDIAVQVCTHITRCFSVAAQFQGCRDKMVEMPTLVKDLCHILYFKHLTKLCSVATECVSSLAVDSILQMRLMQAGALWHLLLFMFSYDFTLEEGGVERNEEENQQEVANKLAKLAVTACARLGGYLTGDLETPSNAVTRSALERLLTPYLSRQLSLDKPAEILKTLNSNCENPYLLWDNGTRAELCEFLEEHRQSRLDMDEEDPTYGSDFTYSMHEKELIVGEIFVRIYNEQPTFPIENSKGFTIDLLEFLASQSNHLSSLGSVSLSESDKKRVEQVIMTLEALSNVIKNNPGVEMQCIGHFRLLFGLLGVDSCKAVQQGALSVVSCVTRNQECVNDIAASDVLVHLLLVLYALVESQVTTLETLYALMSTTKLVKEALNKGAVIYLLDLFCNSNVSIVREKCAELLARMIADKLMGPKVRLTLGRFLPPAFADAMRDSPQACVHMFENTHENPELIWDTDCRKRVCSTIAELKEEHHVAQRQNPKVNWRLPEDSSIVTSANPNELVVAGVYLRLFVDNPGWVLRKPKEFLAELLDTCFNLMSKEKPDVELLELATSALVSLLQAQPALADQVPSLGHIPRICKQMVAQLQQTAVPRAAILILHQLATSEVCISAMAHTDCICPLKKAMQVRKDMIGVACETLHRLFSTNQDQLVRQALDADMVPYLLGLLDGRLDALENPAMTKAQIVKALKSMTRSLSFGEKVMHILDKSSVWTEYKDQRHDLFISNTPIAGYLTGAPPATAGYLTQGPSSNLPDGPPPMDRDDPLGRVDTI